jgi:predicted MPP superfamily phosphohydrolase
MDTPVKKTIKTSILILSDTHTTPLQPLTSPHPFRHPLPQVDLLIHCGDLTTKGLLSEYEETLHLLSSIDAKVKLVIAGNHDRTLDKTWMDAHEGSVFNGEMQVGGKGVYEEARDFWFGDEGRAAKQHVRMLEEGLHVIDLENGAVLTVSLFASNFFIS